MNSHDINYLQKKLQSRQQKISSIWVNIKVLCCTILTVIGIVISLLILPITIVIISGVIIFGVYKILFTNYKD